MAVQAARPAPPPSEIRGPSALGGDPRRFWNLTWLIAVTDFRLTYFGSVLGYLWSLMRPLMLFGVLYLVFSQIVKFGDDIRNYPVLLLLNIVLWTFFVEATILSVAALTNRENLVRKMHFPRMVIPLAVVLTAAFNLAVNLLAVVVFILAYGVDPRWTWLLLPVLLIPLVALTTGVSMLLASLYVRFRDVQPIWAVLTTLLFYATPILYVIEKVPERWQPLVMSNPIAAILEQARKWIVDPSAPGTVEVMGGWLPFMIPCGILVGLCVLGFKVFDHEAPRIAERL